MPNEADTCRQFVDFKQIIGRGTRVRDDYGKLWFNILDYTGTATRNFADPAFDGDPAFATQEEIDEYGQIRKTTVLTTENGYVVCQKELQIFCIIFHLSNSCAKILFWPAGGG